MRTLGMVSALALALIACGGGDDDTTTATTALENTNVLVRVTAEEAGSGCTASTALSGLGVGEGARVVAEDGEGNVLGTGTFQLTPSHESCDWIADVTGIDASADLYRFDAGGELATVSRAELEQTDWMVEVHIDVTGSVILES
ncbi:MAG: hypothetical protein ACRDIL_07485 [Candidatus Limnocylindrales bacterium]